MAAQSVEKRRALAGEQLARPMAHQLGLVVDRPHRHSLAQHGIRHAEDRGVAHQRMAQKHRLHLERRDVGPAANGRRETDPDPEVGSITSRSRRATARASNVSLRSRPGHGPWRTRRVDDHIKADRARRRGKRGDPRRSVSSSTRVDDDTRRASQRTAGDYRACLTRSRIVFMISPAPFCRAR